MNSHDQVLIYSSMPHEQRQSLIMRNVHILDIKNAMEKGFKAEPDLSPHHLPLLSDDALERIFNEAEKWRDKSHERALEEMVKNFQKENNLLSDRYVNLRKILGALDVPTHFLPNDGDPKHIAWTEQKARELVKKAEDSERNRRAAVDAQQRVDLFGRYVKACDEKRFPYYWNVLNLRTNALRDLVVEIENKERLTNCDTNPDRVNHLATRKAQDTEQSLRWHAQRHEALRQLIHRMNNNGEIRVAAASELMDTLLDRPQTGDQSKDWQPAEDWIVWEWQYKPNDLPDDQVVEIRTYGGGENILEAGVVEWSDVEKYRRVK